METYSSRLKRALISEHEKVFNTESHELHRSVRQDLNECPVCDCPDYEIYCVKDTFVHKRCKQCGFVYVDPRLNQTATLAFYNSEVNEIYNEIKFHKEVANSQDDLENLKNYKVIKESFSDTAGKNLLEIGCGKGTFLAKAAKDGFNVYGIEVNKVLISDLKKITGNIYESDILELDLPENHFDVIYFRDVMEHIPQIKEFLKKLYIVLKPGGMVLIDTHNIDSLVNKSTRKFHTVIFAFEHPVHWSPKSLTIAGENAGLKLKNVYFDHKNQSLGRIINYLANPSFTFIFPPNKNKIIRFLLQGFIKVLFVKPILWIDNRIMISISKLTRKGARMQVLFTKE